MINYKNTSTISLTILLIVAVYNLVSSNVLSTKGLVVSTIEQEILKIEKENHELQSKIDESSTLASIEEYANQLGFTQVGQVAYLQGNGTNVALK